MVRRTSPKTADRVQICANSHCALQNLPWLGRSRARVLGATVSARGIGARYRRAGSARGIGAAWAPVRSLARSLARSLGRSLSRSLGARARP
jgi:hypothetical protein